MLPNCMRSEPRPLFSCGHDFRVGGGPWPRPGPCPTHLVGALKDGDAVTESTDYVAAEYTRRTGQALGEPTD